MATKFQEEVAPAAPATGAPVLTLSRGDGFFEFDKRQCREQGKHFAQQYQSADPFPHIVFDQLIDPEFLREVDRQFPRQAEGKFNDAQSRLKTGYSLEGIRSAYIQDLLAAFNSAAFLDFLQNLTGIRGLVSDARFVGGGLHETRRGGHLSIHADFNIHPHSKLHRRLNLILFLNDNWDEAWGGALELWDRNMAGCREKIVPEMGRAVIFNTDSSSYHGHPDPLETPDDVTRRSIALYYYTVPSSFIVPKTTVFRARPGSNDTSTSLASRLLETVRLKFGKFEGN